MIAVDCFLDKSLLLEVQQVDVCGLGLQIVDAVLILVPILVTNDCVVVLSVLRYVQILVTRLFASASTVLHRIHDRIFEHGLLPTSHWLDLAELHGIEELAILAAVVVVVTSSLNSLFLVELAVVVVLAGALNAVA